MIFGSVDLDDPKFILFICFFTSFLLAGQVLTLQNIERFILADQNVMNTDIRIEFRTQTRGYTLLLETDLLGDLIVTRHWFGLQNGRGSSKRKLFYKLEDALKEIKGLYSIKVQN